MSEQERDPVRVVIDHTDGEIKSIKSDAPLSIQVLDYGEDSLKDLIKHTAKVEELPLIPGDPCDTADAESAGVFETMESTVDEEYVQDVHGYVNNKTEISNYARTVIALMENSEDV